mmetsp:Transcript_21532/g.53134  ORF Transcript_21532/g.53134 Transcript_21532/m.53134 type:complete len:133 (+) Transcript_21532:438-836(+)
MGQRIDATPLPTARWFGKSLSLSGNGLVLAIGDPGDVVNGLETGQVRTYAWSSDRGKWLRLGANIVGKSIANNCGESVSLSFDGSMLAVGSIPFQFGEVNVYDWSGSQWVQRGGMPVPGGVDFDYTGNAVSL